MTWIPIRGSYQENLEIILKENIKVGDLYYDTLSKSFDIVTAIDANYNFRLYSQKRMRENLVWFDEMANAIRKKMLVKQEKFE